MTFIESAIQILHQNNNQPMKPRDIWNKISEQNLMKSSGKTPWATLHTMLLYHSKSEYKNKKYFKIVSINPNKFCLLEYSDKISIIDELVNVDDLVSDRILLYQITSKELNWKKLSLYNHEENIEYELTDCEEYTYIIEDKAHATLKIGKTKNDPELRLNQLKTANPSISLLHVFPSTQHSESELHQMFNDFQKDLEWFFYSKGLKTFMSEETSKHYSIVESYKKRIELNEIESKMFSKF